MRRKWFEIKKEIKENKCFYILVFVLIFLAIVPLYKQAIMCNDELQARLWSMKGISQFFEHYIEEQIQEKGRALSSIVFPFTMYLGFLGDSNWTFKVFQILSIVVNAFLFTVFLDKLFCHKSFSIICGLSILVFLPVTFEHTAPNAFNTLYNIPFSLLFISLLLFIAYLNKGKKWMLVCSMLCLFLNLISYETFVMFLPLYGMIAIVKYGLGDKKLIIKKIAPPFFVALVFLVLYIWLGRVFQSTYSGNQIGGCTFASSLKIIKQLVLSSFPGYYIFTGKYKYLAQYSKNLRAENYARALLVCACFGLIIFWFMRKERQSNYVMKWRSLGGGCLCLILPTIPVSVARMYQGNVSPDGFMALPTTYFCYFSATFICWFLIWQLAKLFRKEKAMAVVIAVMVSVYLFQVQIMNDIFSEEQNKDFNNLTTMESLISTKLFASLEGKQFCSDDFFERRHTLAVHGSYWNDFIHIKGLEVGILNETGNTDDKRIYWDGSQFVIWNGDEMCIVASIPKEGFGLCQYIEDEYKIVKYQEFMADNGFYEYFYKLSDDGELEPSDIKAFLEN